jgi:hypothetical protein
VPDAIDHILLLAIRKLPLLRLALEFLGAHRRDHEGSAVVGHNDGRERRGRRVVLERRLAMQADGSVDILFCLTKAGDIIHLHEVLGDRGVFCVLGLVSELESKCTKVYIILFPLTRQK